MPKPPLSSLPGFIPCRKAANVLQQLNAGNRADIADAFDGIEALMCGNTEVAQRLFVTIARRNLQLREAGIFMLAAMFADADEAIMDLKQQERQWQQQAEVRP